MKRIASFAVSIAVVAATSLHAAAQSSQCRRAPGMVSLPVDQPELGSDALALNDLGVAVGFAGDDAALWDGAGFHRLGRTVAVGDDEVEALFALPWDVNNAGTIVGTVGFEDGTRGVVYDPDCACFRALPSALQARAITDDGVIAGTVATANGPRVGLWQDGTLIHVLDATGAAGASPFDISPSGVVVGQARRNGVFYPVMWQSATAPITWLNGPSGVPAGGFARGINADGVMVGTAGGAAVRWSPTGARTVTAPVGTANGINRSGVSVGYIGVNGEVTQGVAWTDAGIVQLGTLGGPSSFARMINASGAIVGVSDRCLGEDFVINAAFRIQLQAAGGR
jgi:hypothetical protein